MATKKISYKQAIQARDEAVAYLKQNGVHDAGVGLTRTSNGLAVKVHLVHPLPDHVEIQECYFQGLPVEVEETGEVFAY